MGPSLSGDSLEYKTLVEYFTTGGRVSMDDSPGQETGYRQYR